MFNFFNYGKYGANGLNTPNCPSNQNSQWGREPCRGAGGVCEADYGPEPFVVDIERCTDQNNNYRTALWTGKHLQLTLMCIYPGKDIGAEVHPHTDQFLRIEEGQGVVKMGDSAERADFQAQVYENCAIFVPAGKWHNVTNTGTKPLRLYSIYAPPHHPHGTVQKTKADPEKPDRY